MLSLFLKSLAKPIKNIGSVAKIFWPPTLLLALYIFLIAPDLFSADLINLPSEISSALASPIVVAVAVSYIILVFLSGVVNWHRMIVLAEPAARARVLPVKRDLFYAGNILWLTVVLYVYQKLIALILRHPLLGEYQEIGELASYLLAPFLMAFLFKRLLLNLPSLSVEENSFHLDYRILAKATKGWKWPFTVGAIIVLTEWMTVLPGIAYWLAIGSGSLPSSLNGFLFLFVSLPLLTVFLVAYGAIALATLLSLFYRDHVRSELLEYNRSLMQAEPPPSTS